MPNFIPSKSVQKLVQYLSQDIESIRPDDWIKRRAELARFRPEKPDYSIVMIARNEERYLFASLASIGEQNTLRKMIIATKMPHLHRAQDLHQLGN